MLSAIALNVVLAVGGLIAGAWYQRRSAARQREDYLADRLQDALAAVSSVLPVFSFHPRARAAWGKAHNEWQRGVRTAELIDCREAADRYLVVGSVLAIGAMGLTRELPDSFIADRAIENAQAALQAVRAGRALPPPCFPSEAEFKALAPMTQDGIDYRPLLSWLSRYADETLAA